jgi:hypothetical protein
MIPHPNIEAITHMPHSPLRKNVHNPHAQASHRYSLINDISQSPGAMLVMEFLQTFPSKRKALISQLGAVDPTKTHLITFDLDKENPRLPSLVTFYIPVKIWNITIHCGIIDKGESTCIMSKIVWKKLDSPELIPLSITLIVYDGRPSQPNGLYQKIMVELGGKLILIDIEVIDAQLDYNILFG